MRDSFGADTRLYALSWRDADDPGLALEAWWGTESLSAGFEYRLDCLAEDAQLELKSFLGRALSLHTRLADGCREARTGLVRRAEKLGSDGGFARYRLTLVPWMWVLGQGRHNRVFQQRTLVQIVEQVFADYRDIADWRWSVEVSVFLEGGRPRDYCVQYEESDYAFLARLLAEEGLGWYVEEAPAAPAGHRVVIFADSRMLPDDARSESGGLRLAGSELPAEDAVLAFGESHRLLPGVVSLLSYDYHTKRCIASRMPTIRAVGGPTAPFLELFDHPGGGAFASWAEADRHARLAIESVEARALSFVGRSLVRRLRSGRIVEIRPLPRESADPLADPRYAIVEVTQVGINNLAAAAINAVAQRLAAMRPECDGCGGEEAGAAADLIQPRAAPVTLAPELVALAAAHGYANAFEALPAATPWRPQLVDDTGLRLNPRPTAPGPMSAVVVGHAGETRPQGPDEVCSDALGRIRVRFHWQQGERGDDRHSCWVRVVTRQAGPGMGWQWLPRIGQEVLVDFLEGDIDRPYVLGALYNGQGESDPAAFADACDGWPGGQGNIVGGHSPAWHGGAAAHGHVGALTGFKSKEFGGAGYNQLVMDDSDDQQRVQLKSTQYASELNLGHLIHQQDNFRGSFRGRGLELRTDAWGALRGGCGVTMSTWPDSHPGAPAGEMAPAIALLKQADSLARRFSQAAATHHSVPLSDEPIAALHALASGRVDGRSGAAAQRDAAAGNTAAGPGKLPHLTAPAIIQAARAGLAQVAGEDLCYASGETQTLASGADSNLAIGGTTRLHAAEAIGVLAGAIAAGEEDTGLSLIAAEDDIVLQAQSGEMLILAKEEVKLTSLNAHIDFAAAKRIHLAVEGGASLTIDGGIHVACPGTITIHASRKSFDGPTSLRHEFQQAPHEDYDEGFIVRDELTGEPLHGFAYRIRTLGGQTVSGTTASDGATRVVNASAFEEMQLEADLTPVQRPLTPKT